MSVKTSLTLSHAWMLLPLIGRSIFCQWATSLAKCNRSCVPDGLCINTKILWEITPRILVKFTKVLVHSEDGASRFLREDVELVSVCTVPPFNKTHFDSNRRQGFTVWAIPKMFGQSSEFRSPHSNK